MTRMKPRQTRDALPWNFFAIARRREIELSSRHGKPGPSRYRRQRAANSAPGRMRRADDWPGVSPGQEQKGTRRVTSEWAATTTTFAFVSARLPCLTGYMSLTR